MLVRSVSEQEEGRRLDRFVMKLFPKAPSSLIYKAVRTKNIKVNGKRCSPADRLRQGDILQIYFSEERAAELGYMGFDVSEPVFTEPVFTEPGIPPVPILYEDGKILAFNKPVGLLSQKDSPKSYSLSEYLLDYLSQKGEYHPRQNAGYRPGLCNRLDRNTSGIVIAAKTLAAAQAVNASIRSHEVEKVYIALCHGQCTWKEERMLCHQWIKDPVHNQVKLEKDNGNPISKGERGAGMADPIKSMARAVAVNKEENVTLFRLRLITGKSHQLRAQLAFEGFPILGDQKYHGTRTSSSSLHAKHQLLHAYQLRLRRVPDLLEDLREQTLTAPPPDDFQDILQRVFPDWSSILIDSGEKNV